MPAISTNALAEYANYFSRATFSHTEFLSTTSLSLPRDTATMRITPQELASLSRYGKAGTLFNFSPRLFNFPPRLFNLYWNDLHNICQIPPCCSSQQNRRALFTGPLPKSNLSFNSSQKPPFLTLHNTLNETSSAPQPVV